MLFEADIYFVCHIDKYERVRKDIKRALYPRRFFHSLNKVPHKVKKFTACGRIYVLTSKEIIDRILEDIEFISGSRVAVKYRGLDE